MSFICSIPILFDILKVHKKLYKTMCLVQNVQNSLTPTKIPHLYGGYTSMGFPQKSAVFDPTKSQKLSTQFEKSYNDQLNACFSFEIGRC